MITELVAQGELSPRFYARAVYGDSKTVSTRVFNSSKIPEVTLVDEGATFHRMFEYEHSHALEGRTFFYTSCTTYTGTPAGEVEVVLAN